MKFSKHLLILSAVSLGFAACSDSDDLPQENTSKIITVDSSFPASFTQEAAQITSKGNITLSFTELNSGKKTEFTVNPDAATSTISLPVGIYDYTGEFPYTVSIDGISKDKLLRCVGKSVTVNSDATVNLDWFAASTSTEGFVIAEIYASGSPNAAGTGGLKDTFVRIYNNSDETLYADGLAIVESDFVNSTANNHKILTEANDRNKNFTVGVVWVIPGSGKDVPVEPGKSIVVCDQAINWGEQVEGALDLTGADFEWYDDHKLDTDNPAVPNLQKWFSYSNTIWVISNQCNRSYAIVRMPQDMTVEKYLSDYKGAYDYEHSSTHKQMHKEKAMLIPNEWILDGVNLGDAENFVRGALGVALDASYACISSKGKDPARFGKAFIRKTQMKLAGRDILQDTDDSAADFTLSKPTLLK